MRRKHSPGCKCCGNSAYSLTYSVRGCNASLTTATATATLAGQPTITAVANAMGQITLPFTSSGTWSVVTDDPSGRFAATTHSVVVPSSGPIVMSGTPSPTVDGSTGLYVFPLPPGSAYACCGCNYPLAKTLYLSDPFGTEPLLYDTAGGPGGVGYLTCGWFGYATRGMTHSPIPQTYACGDLASRTNPSGTGGSTAVCFALMGGGPGQPGLQIIVPWHATGIQRMVRDVPEAVLKTGPMGSGCSAFTAINFIPNGGGGIPVTSRTCPTGSGGYGLGGGGGYSMALTINRTTTDPTPFYDSGDTITISE